MDCKGCQSYRKGGEVCPSHGESLSEMALRKKNMAKGGMVEPEMELSEESDFSTPDSEDEKEAEDLVSMAVKKKRFAKGGSVGGSLNHTAECINQIKNGTHPLTESCPGCRGNK